MTAIENQAKITKMKEPESQKKQEMHCEEDICQLCISVR